MDEFPALDTLMGAYFHQDFEGTSEQVVAAFLEPGGDMSDHLPLEIDLVLQRFQTEPSLDRFLARLGNCYYAPWDGGTYRGWLEDIARQARAYNATHGTGSTTGS